MSLIVRNPSQELVDLVGTLKGRWRGHSAMCLCPAHADGSPSLSLRQGDTGILVHCFAGCSPEDVLRELARIRPIREFSAPRNESKRRSANVDRLWDAGLPIQRSPAELYLQGRGLESQHADLRFHLRCPKGPKPFTKFLPALLVAVREGPRLTAVQRIFLDVKTRGYTDKMMLGSPGKGCWQGARASDELALAEGFESAAAFQELHDVPCWSTLGAERLDRVAIPSDVRTLILAEDNDAEGRRLATKAAAAHAASGLTVRRAPPPTAFGDWADALTGRERGGGSRS